MAACSADEPVMTGTLMTIKYLIGFSITTVLALVTGFSPFTGASAEHAASHGVVASAGVSAGVGAGHNGGHGGHGNDRPDFHPPESPEVQSQISDLREATARFHKIEVAIQEGYAPFGDCFANPPEGNMGYHYSNAELIEDPAVDPNHPELLLYEKQTDGSMKLVGVEYITFQAAWHKAGNRFLPRLFGEKFHLNSVLLDEPFYLLHVWQWKHNPNGRFNDWNPRVTCR
jgi:hypothetical protein